jgi:hypothetical protein
LRGLEKIFLLEHADTLSTLHPLGNYHRDIGEFAEADSIYVRFLAGLEKIADPCRFLALYRSQGLIDEALPLLTQGLDGLVDVFGPENNHSKDGERKLYTISPANIASSLHLLNDYSRDQIHM